LPTCDAWLVEAGSNSTETAIICTPKTASQER
jgi:hypothetical protein